MFQKPYVTYTIFFSWKWSFWEQVGQEWVIWMTNAGKLNFEEWYTEYNYTEFVRAIFQE